MLNDPEELTDVVLQAERIATRSSLLAQGMARAVLRRDGVLPEGAPNFDPDLTASLLDYGYGLLTLALELRRSRAGRAGIADAFRQAGDALDAVTRNDARRPETDFLRTIAAASYHLGGFAARAFVALPDVAAGNNSASERGLIYLLRRDLLRLRQLASSYLESDGSENAIVDISTSSGVIVGIERMLTGQYFRAISEFARALTTGGERSVGAATRLLEGCLGIAYDVGLVPIWWTVRLTIELLDDLWAASLHTLLPTVVPGTDSAAWDTLRTQYIANLINRERSEAELWPSQIAALNLIVNEDTSAVVALPTGAGKTRIAELAILKTLARGRRIMYVTPLRALSAQVEHGLREALRGMTISVSAVYSTIGAQAADVISMREADVAVVTPEKLHFAIRLDPTILDDVGLIVLDEGHMIGLSLREVRYEVLVQRLLRREDALDRRIVCLSAALPSGDDIADFATWITGSPESTVDINWRPTQLRFGQVLWRTDRGWLTFYSSERRDGYFAPRFVEPIDVPTPAGRRLRSFPRSRQELILAVAARYVSDGQAVLIYCPQRNSVESMAGEVVRAAESGAVNFGPTGSPHVARALRIAREWLGREHVAVKSLSVGVGLHHGELPQPVREAMEDLFKGVHIKLLISSPTLAQGLNITVGSVIFSSLYRYKATIPLGEFLNVCGRAGRPYAAAEGHVLYCAYPEPSLAAMNRSLTAWRRLVQHARNRKLRSGIVELVAALLGLMKTNGMADFGELQEYVSNLRQGDQDHNDLAATIETQANVLDKTILALIGGDEIETEDVARALDDVMTSSLWELELKREAEEVAREYKNFLASRAKWVWQLSTAEQRKRFYLAGMNLQDGLTLDQIMPQLLEAYAAVESAIDVESTDSWVGRAVDFARDLFTINAFRGDAELPASWPTLLQHWLSGQPILDGETISLENLQFVQGTCGFHLVWGVEAVRAAVAQHTNADIAEFPASKLSALLEYGVPSVSSALLMKAGLNSRLAAAAVADRLPYAEGVYELLSLLDILPSEHFADVDWVSDDSRNAWLEFLSSHRSRYDAFLSTAVEVQWSGQPLPTGTPVDVYATGVMGELRVYAQNAERPVGTVPRLPAGSTGEPFRAVVTEGGIARVG